MYRAYSQDEVFEIREKKGKLCGLEVMKVLVEKYPQAQVDDDGNAVPEGLFVLRSLPDPSRSIKPMGFLTGSRSELEKIAGAMMFACKNTNPDVAEDWRKFLDIAPENDDVQSYIEREAANGKPFHIPLLQELFHGVPFDKAEVSPLMTKNDMKVRKSAPTLIWSGRSEADLVKARKRKQCKEKTRLTLDGQVSSDDDVEVVEKSRQTKSTRRKQLDGAKRDGRPRLRSNRKEKSGDDLSNIVRCACRLGPNGCLWKDKDASTSHHKCSKCNARIIALCEPGFEADPDSVLCRNCVNVADTEEGAHMPMIMNDISSEQPCISSEQPSISSEQPRKRKSTAILSDSRSERPRGKLLKRHSAAYEDDSEEAEWSGNDSIVEDNNKKAKPKALGSSRVRKVGRHL